MKKRYINFFYIAIGVLLTLFFFIKYPIVFYTADDWNNMLLNRSILPEWGGYNPSKVFPEVFYPIMCQLSVQGMIPIIQFASSLSFAEEYIAAFELTNAIVMAVFITAYVWVIKEFLSSVTKNDFEANIVAVIVLLMHFLLFVSGSENNLYLFEDLCVTGMYHYVLPGLLNAILVMGLFIYHKRETNHRFLAKIVIILGIYFSVFSNMFCSVILVSFSGVYILQRVLETRKIKETLQTTGYEVLSIVLWVISLLFEYSGGRAAAVSTGNGFFNSSVNDILQVLVANAKSMNKLFFLLVIIVIAWGLFIERTVDRKILFLFLLCGFLCFLYSCILSAKINAGYLTRTAILFPMYFYLLLCFGLCFSYVIQHGTFILRIGALCLVGFMLLFFVSHINDYIQLNFYNIPADKCEAIDEDILNQILAANESEDEEFLIYVPKGDDIDNWPHSFFLNETLGKIMYQQKIVHRERKFILEPDAMKNKIIESQNKN